jgi:hypothetical protein
MIELLQLGRDRGYERLKSAVTLALEMGCTDVAAVRYLMQAEGLSHQRVEMVHPGALEKYERGLPIVTHYDQLLTTTEGQEVEP